MPKPYPFVSAKVIADSRHPEFENVRLTTLSVKCPRFIWSEVMTHRMLSKNAQSSRACPVKKMIERVRTNPVMPIEFGSNKPGMQAGAPISGDKLYTAETVWRNASWAAARYAENLISLGVHKQIANRILEPYVQISSVITATEWDNFFKLRIHPAAQPEIHALAVAMKEAMDGSTPQVLDYSDWHLPYITDDENEYGNIDDLRNWSAARCARVSFDNHDGSACDTVKDTQLAESLSGSEPGHWSPFEHQAKPTKLWGMQDNFQSFISSRKQIYKDRNAAKNLKKG